MSGIKSFLDKDCIAYYEPRHGWTLKKGNKSLNLTTEEASKIAADIVLTMSTIIRVREEADSGTG